MITLLALLAAAPSVPPPEPLARQLRAAIWHDLEVNAMIGNGNWIASLWYNAADDDPKVKDLHIQDLACRGRAGNRRCSFNLYRDGCVKMIFREEASDRLTCNATFVWAKEDGSWSLKHIPPREAGHSQTTMKCKRQKA